MAQQLVTLTRQGQRTAGSIINANFAELYAASSGSLPTVQVDTKTASYTLVSGDSSKLLRFNSSTATTLTLPNNLPVGTQIAVVQVGSGVVTFSPASGATLNNRQSFTKTAGQYAICTLVVTDNTGGTSARYLLSGDGVA